MGVHLVGVHLTGVHLMYVHLMGVHLTGVHLAGVSHGRASHGTCISWACISWGVYLIRRASDECVPHSRAPHLRIFLARRTRVARIPVSTPIVLRLLIVGDSAVRLLVTLGERSPRGEKLPKRLLNGRGAARGQSSSSAFQNSTRAYYLNYLQRGRVRRGKEAQAIGLASQSDRQKSDGQTGDRQTS
jgi:hypothetical protein